MKRRIISAVLSLCLVLSAAVPAFAAENSMSNFKASASYSGTFQDVPSSHWAASSVRTCFEYGLMKGVTSSSFDPEGSLTVAQALVMADRVHEIYASGSSTLQNGQPWYQPYVDYALENGMISAGEFSDYNTAVTREQMAAIFSRALPASELTAVNDIANIPDIAGSPYKDEILMLYRAGVLTGSDIYGTFLPDSSIRRSEAAAIISRVAIPSERKNVTLMKKYVWSDEPSVTVALPQDAADISDNGDTSFAGSDSFIYLSTHPENYPSDYDITAVSAADLSSMFTEGFADAGIAFSGAQSSMVKFGTLKAYRTTGIMNVDGQSADSIIYTYIDETGLKIIALATFGNDALLKTLSDNLTVNGSAAVPQI